MGWYDRTAHDHFNVRPLALFFNYADSIFFEKYVEMASRLYTLQNEASLGYHYRNLHLKLHVHYKM